MKVSSKILSVVVGCFLLNSGLYGQQTAAIYLDYQKNPTTAVLPNFSYVGYHYGEKAIPDCKHLKVFNVLDYGAIPNDDLSDKKAIQKAIDAASKKGGGIVLFPKGRFLVNEDNDDKEQIVISSSNIVLRGSGSGQGGTELFMKNMLPPRDSTKMWSTPSLFTTKSNEKSTQIGHVKDGLEKGADQLYMDNTPDIQPGDWIQLRMKNNDPALVQAEMGNHEADPTWTSLVKDGVFIKMVFQVKNVSNNHLQLFAPIPFAIDAKYPVTVFKFAHIEEIGLENIAFVGNWHDKFIHHRSWKDDSGFTLWKWSCVVNGWVNQCRFSDMNSGMTISEGANITVLNCLVSGNPGHEAISNNGGTNILLANITDSAGEWHSVGVAGPSMNTVVYKAFYPPSTCFESHSSQPRNTLLDGVSGGFYDNHAGGAHENLPNHLGNLVLWNYHQTNAPFTPFDFWPSKKKFWRIPAPIIVGFTGGTTFIPEQLQYEESNGKTVQPTSLYEAQLKLRLGKLPAWLGKK